MIGVRPITGSINNIEFPEDVHFGLGTTLYDDPRSGYSKEVTAESEVKAPSKMISIAGSRFLSEEENSIPGGYSMLQCGWLRYQGNFAFDPSRHGNDYNVVFCDGHVEGMDPGILFDPSESARLWNYDHKPHPELWMP